MKGRFDRRSAGRQRAGGTEAFLLNPQPLPARTVNEWRVVAEVVANGKAVARARDLADLYLRALASIRWAKIDRRALTARAVRRC